MTEIDDHVCRQYDHSDIFDSELRSMILDLADLCAEHGVNFIMGFDVSNDGVGTQTMQLHDIDGCGASHMVMAMLDAVEEVKESPLFGVRFDSSATKH